MAEDIRPSESLRVRLAHLGIPREAHEVGTLARMLPVCLDGSRLDGIDADAVAETLSWLIENGIVRPPCHLDGLLDPHWGAHLCHFYRGEQDLLEFLTAYFRRGLECGEYCLWVAPDRDASLALRAALASAVPHLDRFEGALECRTHDEWYVDGARQLKAADALIAELAHISNNALQAGYEGLRCAGWTPRIDHLRWRSTAEHECEVNAALSSLKIKAVCAYPLLDCGTRELTDLRESHHDLVVRGDGWWHRVSADPKEASAVIIALRGGV